MVGKNPVLKLWFENPKANQNAGLFKLEYPTNKLWYELEFFGVTRGP